MNDVYRAIADPTRREILDCLAKKEESVTQLAKAFSMSLPAVSQHLKVLQDSRLITGRREGRYIFYRLSPGPLREVALWLNPYGRFWRERLNALDAHLRRRHSSPALPGKEHEMAAGKGKGRPLNQRTSTEIRERTRSHEGRHSCQFIR